MNNLTLLFTDMHADLKFYYIEILTYQHFKDERKFKFGIF